MKLKRLAALALAVTMLVPSGILPLGNDMAAPSTALALSTSNLTGEDYRFTMSGTYSVTGTLPAVYPSDTSVSFDSLDQKDNENNSFAYAAIAALNVTAAKQQKTGGFSLAHLNVALSNANNNNLGFSRGLGDAGNRAMVAAYLSRGKQGGPVIGADEKRYPITGITYIPDLPTSSTANNRNDYLSQLKMAVRDKGAVGISVYMDDNRIPLNAVTDDENFYDYPASKTPDHTVVLLGWDDTIDIPPYYVTTGSGSDEKVTEFTPDDGAFWVQDSINGAYWMTYDTILKTGRFAYYINGFIPNSDFTTLSDASNANANAFGLSYEYDTFGQNDATGFGTNSAYFANVFSSSSNASSLQAVSLFLTGEGSSYEIYYCAEYTGTKDLHTAIDQSNLVAQGSAALPGYYTIPIDVTARILLPATGKKFALIAKVTTTKGTNPVPLQTGRSGSTGRGYAAAVTTDGSEPKWVDVYSGATKGSICLKAHAENGLNIVATGVSLPTTKDEDGVEKTKNGYPVLEVAPGKTYNIGPMTIPLNAANIMPNSTRWWMSDDIEEDDTLAELVYDFDDPADTSSSSKKEPTKMGHPKYLPPADEEEDDDDDPLPAPITLNMSKSNQQNNSFNLSASDDQRHFGKEFYLKVSIQPGTKDTAGNWTKEGDPFETTIIVRIASISVEKLELSKTEQTLKANASFTLKATITPSDASVKNPVWKVAKSYDYNSTTKEYTYTPYDLPYNAGDPYNENGPIVTVSDTGKVTAVKDGVCYVYAQVEQGEIIYSAPCKITVTRVDATGLTLGKKKMTISTGTTLTLPANVKPTSASNKKVVWEVTEGNSVISVDANSGVLTALTPGVGTLKATTVQGGYSAECVITVSNAPSGVYKQGKSVTMTVLGTSSKDTVEWQIQKADGQGGYQLADTTNPLDNGFFSASKNSHKLKATASTVGRVMVTGTVTSKAPDTVDEDGNTITHEPVVVRQQSWVLESVIAFSKLQLMNVDPADPDAVPDLTDPPVKKVTLCVDASNPSRNQSIDLQAVITKPTTGATLLDFEWSSKKPEVADVTVMQSAGTHNSHVTIQAKSNGSTKITGVNYNGKKKVSVTIKVLDFPKELTAKNVGTDDEPYLLTVGKSKGLTSKINEKKVNKSILYTLYDENGDLISETDPDPIATVNAKGKVFAKREGTVTLVARGAPFDDTAPKTELVIDCVYPVRKVIITGPKTVQSGETATIKASVDPVNATNPALTLTGANLTNNGDGTYSFTPVGAGKVTIIATSVENPKRSRKLNIKVVPAPTPSTSG